MGPLSGIIRNSDIFKTCVTRVISQSETTGEMNRAFEISPSLSLSFSLSFTLSASPFCLLYFSSTIRHQSFCSLTSALTQSLYIYIKLARASNCFHALARRSVCQSLTTISEFAPACTGDSIRDIDFKCLLL